tara:strand:- start:47 stop:406 length:360 start_codon:yes stop_codon:yes gene_type:complete
MNALQKVKETETPAPADVDLQVVLGFERERERNILGWIQLDENHLGNIEVGEIAFTGEAGQVRQLSTKDVRLDEAIEKLHDAAAEYGLGDGVRKEIHLCCHSYESYTRLNRRFKKKKAV